MNRQKGTFVPNEVFDEHLKELKGIELKLLLIIIRQTIGWKDKNGGRKESDWISGGQLQSKTGSSQRAISSAAQTLINKNFIEITDNSGNVLPTPEERRGQPRLYYKLTSAIFSGVEREGISDEHQKKTEPANANISQGLRKKMQRLQQKFQITK